MSKAKTKVVQVYRLDLNEREAGLLTTLVPIAMECIGRGTGADEVSRCYIIQRFGHMLDDDIAEAPGDLETLMGKLRQINKALP